MLKQALSAYFGFTKKERLGIIAILALIIFFIILPFLYPFFIKPKPADAAVFKKEVDALHARQDSSAGYSKNKFDEGDGYTGYNQPEEKAYYNRSTKGELFYFDPNTATAAEWQRLGLRDKTISTILKYVSKGGHFYKPEDIGKIWGLHPAEVQRLLPWVRITPKEKNGYAAIQKEAGFTERPPYSPAVIDINIADTAALIALPGIGSRLAQRIIHFREKLGGFYNTAQFAETYGLPDSTFQKIKAKLTVSTAAIKQFNINMATAEELKQHPYIRYALANAIVQYRNQHGNFNSVEDIKKIMLVTEEIYSKAAPYLKVE